METAIYLSLSQNSSYSLNSTGSTEAEHGDHTHLLLASHPGTRESRKDRKINTQRKEGLPHSRTLCLQREAGNPKPKGDFIHLPPSLNEPHEVPPLGAAVEESVLLIACLSCAMG